MDEQPTWKLTISLMVPHLEVLCVERACRICIGSTLLVIGIPNLTIWLKIAT